MKTKPPITKSLKNSALRDRLQYFSMFISFGVSTSAALTVIQTAHGVLITPLWREQGSWKHALNWVTFSSPAHCVWAVAQTYVLESRSWGIFLAHCHCQWNMSFLQMFLVLLGAKCSSTCTKTYLSRQKVWRRKKFMPIYSMKSGFQQTLFGEHYLWTTPIFWNTSQR